MSERAEKIRHLLRDRLAPTALEVIDRGPEHAGHAGAALGSGHFSVRIISEEFRGHSLIERHRMVYQALGEMFPRDIHALAIDARTPEEVH